MDVQLENKENKVRKKMIKDRLVSQVSLLSFRQ